MPNNITRTYTFSNGGVADGGQVDTEIAAVVNAINNADAGTATWTQVKAATLTSTTSTVLKGTTTNDSAAAGNIGEIISSVYSDEDAAANNVYGDLTSISLTAGDWDVTHMAIFVSNGGTWTQALIAVSATAGDDSTGLADGSNMTTIQVASTSTAVVVAPLTVASFRVSIASTTTYYAKQRALYSAGTLKYYGRLSARRVR